jgi:adenylate cyclase
VVGLVIQNTGLSVISADVVGAQRLSLRSDVPEAAYAVGRCEKRIQRSVEIHGGNLIRRQDGGLMAFFKGSLDALQSAIEMQHRVLDLPPSSGVSLGVKVGICTGHEAREQCYFPSTGANPAVSLSSLTDPGHILLSVPRRAKVFDWLHWYMDSVPDLALNCGKRRLGVFNVGWQERDPVALRVALSQFGRTAGQLFVHHQGSAILLDENRPLTSIGRMPNCDLVMRDSRCSRMHGSIERRLDRFVFVDRSTNGTFVKIDGQAEVLVHRKELALYGGGQLSFGAPASAKGVDQVRFQNSGLA